MGRIILLTAPECAPHVGPLLAAAGVEVTVAVTRADLEHSLASGTQGRRLVSFGAGVIVPEGMLQALPGPAYNFHPGPPSLPGLFPSVHALYARQATFGVTLHEMATLVDSGPIVAVDAFPIPADSDRLSLDTLTFAAMLAMVARFAPALANIEAPLIRSSDTWSGPRKTSADFASLCALPEDADEIEFQHRLRAVGEGPHHALTLTRFGRAFKLTSQDGRAVTRAGLPVR